MFWGALILFVGSFILTNVLTPKPKIENARAEGLENLRYPRADAGSPIPILYGRMLLRSPNTIWTGPLTNWPMTQQVQTGTFSKETQTTGYIYFFSFALGLCLGPEVKLFYIQSGKHEGGGYSSAGMSAGWAQFVNLVPYDEAAWTEMRGDDGLSDGYRPVHFLDGAFDQDAEALIVQQLGTSDTSAYRGIAYVVFYAPYIGYSPQLPQIHFDIGRFPNTLGQTVGVQKIGQDLNPMEVLYAMFTETWGGMGLAAANFDKDSFVYAAEVLADEDNGASFLIDTPNQIKSLAEEVLRQVDGVLFQEPTTGEITVKLIRDDYDVETLPLLTPSSVVAITNFTCSSWDETYNQVRVKYTKRTSGGSYSEQTALAQDFSNIALQGKVRSTTLSFPGVHTQELAVKIAARELAYSSVPLYRATVVADRTAFQLRPGSPFRLTWPEYGLDEVVFRVQKFNMNELANGRIAMEVIQDKFAAMDAIFDSEDTLDPGTERPATSVTEFIAFESPYWFVAQVADMEEPANSAWFWFFAKPGGASQVFYSVFTSDDNFAANEVGVRDLTRVPYPPRATLVGDVYKMMGMTNGRLTQITVGNIEPEPGSGVSKYFIGSTPERIREWGRGIFAIGNELMSFETSTNNLDGTFTLSNVHRALLDTAPEDHAEGDIIFFFAAVSPTVPSGLTWFSRVVHDETDPLYFRFVSSTDNTSQPVADAAKHTITPVARYERPLPPDMTEVESMRIATDVIILTTTLNVSGWYTRNRISPNEVVLYTDSEDTVESDTTHEFDFYVDNILVATKTGVTGAAASTTITVRGKGLARLESYANLGTAGSKRSFTPDIVEFFFAYYPNLSATLLTNGTFEGTGTTGWTVVAGSWTRPSTVYPLNTIKPGTYHIQSASASSELSQVVDIVSPTDYRGKAAIVRVLKGGKTTVASRMTVELLDSGDAVLDTVSTPLSAPEAIGKWELLEVAVPILSTAAKIKIRLIASGVSAVFDNAAIRVNTLSPTMATKYDALTGITPRGAWGLRTLISTYSGPLVRVRDTYDDTETDLYADADGNLEAFFTVGQARVVTLYDQSASAVNLTSTVTKQPLLKTHISATGRAAIEFDAEPASLFDAVSSTTRPYMVTRPNCSLVIGPKWNTGTSHFIAGVSHKDASHETPYYRFGLRCGSTNWTYVYNSTQTAIAGAGSCAALFSVWWLDYQNGAIYHNEDTTPTSSFTPENITYPNTTRLRLAESAEELQNWEGYFFELCVFEGNISNGDRKTMMEALGLYWHNLAV